MAATAMIYPFWGTAWDEAIAETLGSQAMTDSSLASALPLNRRMPAVGADGRQHVYANDHFIPGPLLDYPQSRAPSPRHPQIREIDMRSAKSISMYKNQSFAYPGCTNVLRMFLATRTVAQSLAVIRSLCLSCIRSAYMPFICLVILWSHWLLLLPAEHQSLLLELPTQKFTVTIQKPLVGL
jgi:hypothetical protein